MNDLTNKTLIHQATSKFISKSKFDFFITLHFKKEIKKDQAREILRRFLNSFNGELFGSRSLKSLIQISAIEKNRENNSFHVHIICERPFDKISKPEKRNIDYFKKAIKETWKKSSKINATEELKLNKLNPEWIKEIYDNEGICLYISKQILSGHFDVIEWDKANTTGRRYK